MRIAYSKYIIIIDKPEESTISIKQFNSAKYASKHIGCQKSFINNCISQYEEDDVSTFNYNDYTITIKSVVPRKIYVKYISNSNITLYLIYKEYYYGYRELLKTLNEEQFKKLEIPEDKIITYTLDS